MGLAILAQGLRWPNGPWPGEKTAYFPGKTGQMARHGFWPSDPQANFAPMSPQRSGLDPFRSRCVNALAWLDGSDAEENTAKPTAYATWL